ncbi:c-type cytochrome [Desulfuribacillus alkaliarsenatis]|uniref:Cytochrome c domain-containing protein n=1 Tax=Desulfuribacillus alkaliarsenatis TaxID=766136 RepID=A0A1E5G3Z9_9FIRM|nr:cytochrome c [Desulfuribacillus alkaliarsenatis]OEF97810.1 hypothetical protein BHF68_13320 [Desulfuribacillus alkaliarsenatis]
MKQFKVVKIDKKHWMWLGISVTIVSLAIILSMCTGSPFIGDRTNTEASSENVEESKEQSTAEIEQQRMNAKRWYNQSCALCHGEQLEGRLQNPPLLNTAKKYTADQVYTIIIDGRGDMTGGFLQGDEARAVAEWLIEIDK